MQQTINGELNALFSAKKGQNNIKAFSNGITVAILPIIFILSYIHITNHFHSMNIINQCAYTFFCLVAVSL